MLSYAKEQRSLARNQKEAIGLICFGTFFEYFDLMLYIHMAVVINELFFPKTDPQVASLLSTAAFCSTYLLSQIWEKNPALAVCRFNII